MYVDSYYTLLRVDIQSKAPFVVVFSEEELPPGSHSFTLSAFSRCALTTFCPAAKEYPYEVSIDGRWESGSTGGNANSKRPTRSKTS